MSKWKATMPKEKPAKGRVKVVFAYKTAAGERMEYVGEISSKTASTLMEAIIDAGIAKEAP